MKEDIAPRFRENLARVESLLGLYGIAERAQPGVHETDLLRAAVVFLHATLEDLIRSLLEWKLPSAPADALEDVVLPGFRPRTKFGVRDLAAYRGRTIDELLRAAVAEHLLESNFNHPGELADALAKTGLAAELLEPYRHHLGPLMQRRHWIVHRADRSQEEGALPQATRPLEHQALENWLGAVRAFGTGVLDAM